MILPISLHQAFSAFFAQGPCGRRRQSAAIDAVKIAACRKNVQPTSGRGATGAGGNKAAIQTANQVFDFVAGRLI